MQWGSFVSLNMLDYEVISSLIRAAPFWGSLDLSQPWETLDEIYKKGLDVD